MNIKNRVLAIIIAMVMLIPVYGCNKAPSDPPAEQAMSPEATETPADTLEKAEAPESKTVSFIGAGDNIVYYGTVRDAQSMAVSGGRKYNFKPIYSDVQNMIEEADIAFINQETLMCGEGYELDYYPTFNGPQDMGHDLVELGFDVINIATNHMADKGGAGLEKTIEFWKARENILMIGGYSDKTDFDNIRVYEKNGIRIAFLAYTYSTNGITVSSKYSVVVPYLDKEDITRQVTAAKEVSDIVIVSAHWGDENSFTPNDEQKEYAKLMADLGVGAIIGHHPHVLQPIEWITGSGGNRMLCVYSLGNFMAEMAADYNMVGGLIKFDITQLGGARATVENVSFVPTVFDFSTTFYNNHIYLLENYTEEQAAGHGIRYYKKSTTLSKLRSYVTNTISPEFLPEA